jgi:hypothetical protein
VTVKCCRSNPRCRNCPAHRIEDERLLRALGVEPGPWLPAHLSGLPASLHKYEPLLRKAWVERVEDGRAGRLELELVAARQTREPAPV